jgi:transposase-like protein
MTRGVAHSPELRAEAVAAVLAGMSVAQAAAQFGLRKQTLSEWLQTDEVRTVRTVNTRTREAMSHLIYDALTATLNALIARAVVTGSAHWIEKQSAAELAQLGATEWDRILRLVSGYRPVEQQQPAGLAAPADATPGPGDDDR